MSLRAVFQGVLAAGALFALVGGAAIGIVTMIEPQMELLPRLELGYRQILLGFGWAGLLAVGATLIDMMGRIGRPAPPPAAVPFTPAAPAGQASGDGPAAKPLETRRLEEVYHEMKTYIDLEMWELALEKANLIVQDHPASKEAELVSRNLNELRWKAEPKFVAAHAPITADQEKALREKGLAAMYNHVKTYMDLEMWELARQKSVAIMKSFPDSPEANELMKVYEMIEKKARATASSEVAEKAER